MKYFKNKSLLIVDKDGVAYFGTGINVCQAGNALECSLIDAKRVTPSGTPLDNIFQLVIIAQSVQVLTPEQVTYLEKKQ